ncbi:uncharacterized protein Z520_05370 [Fonsecaea multimorphosa CBS 102226]|uniref:Uncharacterized protein n=1 Tax=Fonsecaea multimorphosa CBS 102226 TaxID=1442371 RepID=A0A0D2K726_9EURO|nr:uncharacterized protein Z520_05370 [Fonsecaea multimorphosa CBS 102226]KIX98909.1 hypothetical protein Z520_05370 [Fonsecaea multimorphosa CBS 102226]
MGGFMLGCPDNIPFPVNAHQICYLATNDFMEFPEIEKKDIWDKNKADGLCSPPHLDTGVLVRSSVPGASYTASATLNF